MQTSKNVKNECIRYLFKLETFNNNKFSVIIQCACNIILNGTKIYAHKLITKFFREIIIQINTSLLFA